MELSLREPANCRGCVDMDCACASADGVLPVRVSGEGVGREG